jgi:hypothetical protein
MVMKEFKIKLDFYVPSCVLMVYKVNKAKRFNIVLIVCVLVTYL